MEIGKHLYNIIINVTITRKKFRQVHITDCINPSYQFMKRFKVRLSAYIFHVYMGGL